MKNKIKEFKELVFAREMSILPGNLAFSFFMAIIPILTLIFYISTQFHLPMDIINNFLSETFPKGVVDLLQPVLTNSISMDSVITLVVGFTVAANGCNAIIIASNTIFGLDNSSFLRRMIKAVFLTFCIVLLFGFIVIVQVLGSAIISLIGSFTSIIADNQIIVDTLYFILRVPVSLIVVYLFIKLVYVIAPDEKIPSKYMIKGALFTTISYDDGWSIYVDGKKVKTKKVLNAFLSCDIKRGTHDIKMIYYPKKMKEGLIVSMISLVIFIMYNILLKKGKNKNMRKDEFIV